MPLEYYFSSHNTENLCCLVRTIQLVRTIMLLLKVNQYWPNASISKECAPRLLCLLQFCCIFLYKCDSINPVQGGRAKIMQCSNLSCVCHGRQLETRFLNGRWQPWCQGCGDRWGWWQQPTAKSKKNGYF